MKSIAKRVVYFRPVKTGLGRQAGTVLWYEVVEYCCYMGGPCCFSCDTSAYLRPAVHDFMWIEIIE